VRSRFILTAVGFFDTILGTKADIFFLKEEINRLNDRGICFIVEISH
jgi:hypothetical protein